MSFQSTHWAFSQKLGNAVRKMVLIALADHHNKETGLCCPKISTLAADAGVSERTVYGHLAALREIGLIEWEQQHRKDGSRAANSYRLNLTNLQNLQRPPEENDIDQPADSSPLPAESAGQERTWNIEPEVLGADAPTRQATTSKRRTNTKTNPRRKVDMPPDWHPHEKHTAKAQELRVNIHDELFKFRNHHEAKGNQFVSWDAAFYTWLANAATYASERPTAVQQPVRVPGWDSYYASLDEDQP
jgi:DNA-binding transcriptional ArsR family regulator